MSYLLYHGVSSTEILNIHLSDLFQLESKNSALFNIIYENACNPLHLLLIRLHPLHNTFLYCILQRQIPYTIANKSGNKVPLGTIPSRWTQCHQLQGMARWASVGARGLAVPNTRLLRCIWATYCGRNPPRTGKMNV